ncbi:MAG TPA: DUF4197 domain-containing protein [Dissulfurispiraceae bacterium]|nr:DUF4197 domain-containing protein [Dissulfurispiraceae bacterium]
MRSGVTFLILLFTLIVCTVHADASSLLDTLLQSKPSVAPAKDNGSIGAGLKEALAVGTENAVKKVSAPDGYFGNQLIRILMPEKLRKIADTLSMVGYKKEVDEFVLSMNRAAEKAAPKAAPIFGDAIRQMSIDDARKILAGGNTAATDFFKEKTTPQLTTEFKPIISKSLDDAGATHAYKNMIGKADNVPFLKKESLDLDGYVTGKALDGLFTVVGQEEKLIRTDPAARVTDLLRSTFGH